MVIPVAGVQTWTHTFACLHRQHTYIHKHAQKHTLSKKHLIQGHIFSFRIQAANAGSCSCCFLDISLPKGIYFILPSNPLSPQFSHFFFLCCFLFLKYLETSLRIWPQCFPGVTPGPSVCLLPSPPSILCSVERVWFRPGNFAHIVSSLVCFGTSILIPPLYHERTFTDRCLWTTFIQCSRERRGKQIWLGCYKICAVSELTTEADWRAREMVIGREWEACKRVWAEVNKEKSQSLFKKCSTK